MAAPTAPAELEKADYPALLRAVRLAPTDEGAIAERLYRLKAKEYRLTLLRLGRRYGHKQSRVVLSEEIRRALRAEAERDARSVIKTFDSMVAGYVNRERAKGRDTDELIDGLSAFMRQRARTRSEVAARSSRITPRLDAQLAFFRENGVDPHFNMTGPAPECQTCKALIANNPHSIEVVLEVGIPHIGCTHSWSARRISPGDLRRGGLRPGRITLGRGGPAGIVGSRTLQEREGGQIGATDRIQEIVDTELVEELTDRDGAPLALSRESAEHIVRRHPEMDGLQELIARTAIAPEVVEPDRRSARIQRRWRRFEIQGRTRWIMVAVKFVAEDRGYIQTAHLSRRGPRR
jgi:hypothetical protein